MRNPFLFSAVICLFCSCRVDGTAQISASERDLALQADAIEQSVLNTPYSALIRITSVDSIQLPDDDPSDDYSERKDVYHADVLETYRGESVKNITYLMYVEQGESAEFSRDPFIVALCRSDDGLYWPGVGASFAADEKLVEIARKAGGQADRGQVVFSDCE